MIPWDVAAIRKKMGATDELERWGAMYPVQATKVCRERQFFIDNLLVRIHFIIVMIW